MGETSAAIEKHIWLSAGRAERRGWSFLSETSLQRIWDNEVDDAYAR